MHFTFIQWKAPPSILTTRLSFPLYHEVMQKRAVFALNLAVESAEKLRSGVSLSTQEQPPEDDPLHLLVTTLQEGFLNAEEADDQMSEWRRFRKPSSRL